MCFVCIEILDYLRKFADTFDSIVRLILSACLCSGYRPWCSFCSHAENHLACYFKSITQRPLVSEIVLATGKDIRYLLQFLLCGIAVSGKVCVEIVSRKLCDPCCLFFICTGFLVHFFRSIKECL